MDSVEKRCSIRDVAAKAQLSASLVSRVLNQRPTAGRIPVATREWIERCAAELNYTPNVNAKRLFSRRSGLIALVLPTLAALRVRLWDDNHLRELLPGLEIALSERKYRMMLIFNDERFVTEKEYLSLFRSHAIDGMLVWGACAGENFWAEVVREEFPLVFLTSNFTGEVRYNHVMHDYAEGAFRLTEHFLRQGFRKFGWIGGPRDHSITRMIEEGIARALAGAPDATVAAAYGTYQPDAVWECATEVLRQEPQMEVLIVSNAKPAAALAEMRKTAGLPPLRLAACDSCPGELEDNPMPRVVVDDQNLARTGIQALCRIIEDHSEHCEILCPVQFAAGAEDLVRNVES